MIRSWVGFSVEHTGDRLGRAHLSCACAHGLDRAARRVRDDEVGAAIYALARVHELVLYDPQGPEVYLPTDPIIEEEEFPGFGLGDWLKIGAMVAALTGVTYAAWLIPNWLKWPIVLVAGFFALAAWFVLVAMMFGRQIMKPEDARH